MLSSPSRTGSLDLALVALQLHPGSAQAQGLWVLQICDDNFGSRSLPAEPQSDVGPIRPWPRCRPWARLSSAVLRCCRGPQRWGSEAPSALCALVRGHQEIGTEVV